MADVQQDKERENHLQPKEQPEQRNGTPDSGKRTKDAAAEGDNDSGVDESTQGARQERSKSRTRTQQSPSGHKQLPLKSPRTPEPNAAALSATPKKVPMNKVQVGAAPSPNLKAARSKIGSLDNSSYQPQGGDKKIVHKRLNWEAKSKIGSLENTTHKPGGGDKKITSVKLDFKDKAKSRVASKDNIKHVPGGGDVKWTPDDYYEEDIDTKKIDIKAASKVGSLDNVKYKPGGGGVKIFDDKEYLRQKAIDSSKPTASSSEWYKSGRSGLNSIDEDAYSMESGYYYEGEEDRRSRSACGRRNP